MRRFCLVACALIMTSPTVHAQTNALGYGLTPCGEFVSGYEPQQRMKIFSWAAGYFTGANLATKSKQYRDLTGLADPAFVVTRLLDHCTRNPHGVLLEAVQQIYLSLPVIAIDPTSYPGARKSSAAQNF